MTRLRTRKRSRCGSDSGGHSLTSRPCSAIRSNRCWCGYRVRPVDAAGEHGDRAAGRGRARRGAPRASMPRAPPDTTVQSRSARPCASSAATYSPYDVLARAPTTATDRSQRLGQRPGPRSHRAVRRIGVAMDRVGSSRLMLDQVVELARPLVVAGDDDAGAEPLGHVERVLGQRAYGSAPREAGGGHVARAAAATSPCRRRRSASTGPTRRDQLAELPAARLDQVRRARCRPAGMRIVVADVMQVARAQLRAPRTRRPGRGRTGPSRSHDRPRDAQHPVVTPRGQLARGPTDGPARAVTARGSRNGGRRSTAPGTWALTAYPSARPAVGGRRAGREHALQRPAPRTPARPPRSSSAAAPTGSSCTRRSIRSMQRAGQPARYRRRAIGEHVAVQVAAGAARARVGGQHQLDPGRIAGAAPRPGDHAPSRPPAAAAAR